MYGVLTLLPPVLAISIALIKRDVVAALFIGVLSGSIIMNGWNFIPPIASQYMVQGWKDGVTLLMLLVLMSTMVWQISESGGFLALSGFARKHVKSRRGAKFISWLLCILCSVEDSMAVLGSGTISRPITDDFRIPREKLAYNLSSVGSNFLSMMPYSAYILFGAGLISAYAPGVDGTMTYLKMIPFNAYAIISIVLSGLFSAEILPDFGPMKRAEKRALETGKVGPKGSEKASIYQMDQEKLNTINPDFKAVILPIGGMIATLIVSFMLYHEIQIHSAVLVGAMVSIIYPLITRRMKFNQISEKCFEGFKSMVPLFVILFMSFTFSSTINAMGFGDYIVSLVGNYVNKSFLPIIMYLICCLVAYATGSFATALTIMCPVAIPLALASGAYLPLTFAACLGGSQFGDQSSPISDVFIISSMTAGVPVGDSAHTLFPYKLLNFGLAAIMFVVFGFVVG